MKKFENISKWANEIKMIGIFSLYRGHLKSSKRIILYSCVGLIIALTLISSSLYFLESSRQLVLNNYLKDNSTGNDIQFNIQADFTTQVNSSIKTINSGISNATSRFNFNFINNSATSITYGISNFKVASSIFLPSPYYHNAKYLPVTIFQLTPEIQSELQHIHMAVYGNNSITLPQQSTNVNSSVQVYALFNGLNWVLKQPVTNISNGMLEISTSYKSRYLYEESFNVNVIGFEALQSYYYSPYQNENFLIGSQQSKYPSLYSYSLMTNTAFTPSIMLFASNITQFSNQINQRIQYDEEHPSLIRVANRPYMDNKSVFNIYIVNLVFDYSKLSFTNINSFLNRQDFFSGSVIELLGVQGYQVSAPFYLSNNLFVQMYNQILNLTNQIIFIDIPSLIIALFLAHYVFNLIYRNIIRNIGIYKIRGISGRVIFLFQIFDLFIVLILSILTAFLLGIPLSVFSLKSNNILSFNNPLPSIYVFDFQSVAIILVYSAIILEIIINTNRIRKLSKITISEVDNPVEKADTFWNSYFMDFLLIFYGLGTYFLMSYIYSKPDIHQFLTPVLPIIDILMIPTPFVFTIGCILLLSRTVPMFLNKLITFLWSHTDNLTALSFKNLIRYKNNAIRAILITATIIAFLTFFYAQPYTMLETYQQNVYYQAGADAVAVFKSNSIDQTVIQRLSTVYSAYIDSVCSFVLLGGNSQNSGINQQLNFLLVNVSTYFKTAFLNYSLGLQDHSVSNAISKLKISNVAKFLSSTPVNILIDHNDLSPLDLSVGANNSISGKTLPLGRGNSGSLITVQNFYIVDSFTKWPFILPHAGKTSGTTVNAIGSINYFLKDLHGNIGNSIFSYVKETGLFIKFKDITPTNLKSVITQIQEKLPLRFTNIPKLQYEQNLQEFAFFAIGEVNINVLISLAIIVIVILLFIQLQMVERKREIYTEQAMGMKLSQLAYIFYIENIFIIIFSIIVGTVGGTFLIQIMDVIASNSSLTYIYTINFVPLNMLLLTDLIILLLSFIISLFPTIMILRQDISEAFTGEFNL